MNLFDTVEGWDIGADVVQALGEMVGFAEAAGALALDLRAKGLDVTHKGDLGQALTEADQAISRMMAARFGPRVIEEETATGLSLDECRAMLAGEAWTYVGDPIDGTRPFSGGLSAWGTMIAACRNGWPVAGVLSLPAWVDQRDRLDMAPADIETRGVLLASAAGRTVWAPTRGGKLQAAFQTLNRATTSTHHVGWLPVAAKNFTLDYTKGFFPHCESASISDFASLVTGRREATTFNAGLWDLAGAVPAIEAAGFRLFSWPDLEPPPAEIIGMFSQDFYSGDRIWLVARDADYASRLAQAIRRGNPA